MLYCYSYKQLPSNKRVNAEMNEAKKRNCFIYYNKNYDVFFNQNDEKIDVKCKKVFPVVGVLDEKIIISALIKQGAIIRNSIEDIDKIKEWFKYVQVNRKMIDFKGYDLDRPSFLEYIKAYFNKEQLFLKTKEKDYNGIISIYDLFNQESDLRKAFNYHQNDTFLLAEIKNKDFDEMGYIEYRAFIIDGKITSISRMVEDIYHQIDQEVLDFIENTIKKSAFFFSNYIYFRYI